MKYNAYVIFTSKSFSDALCDREIFKRFKPYPVRPRPQFDNTSLVAALKALEAKVWTK